MQLWTKVTKAVAGWTSTTSLVTLIRTLSFASLFATVTAAGAGWYFDHAIAVRLLHDRDLLEADVLVGSVDEALNQSIHLLSEAADVVYDVRNGDSGPQNPTEPLARLLRQYPATTGFLLTDDAGRKIISIGQENSTDAKQGPQRMFCRTKLALPDGVYEIAVTADAHGPFSIVVSRTLAGAKGERLQVAFDPGRLLVMKKLGGNARLRVRSLQLSPSLGKQAVMRTVSTSGNELAMAGSRYDDKRNIVDASYYSSQLPVVITLEAVPRMAGEGWRWVGYKEIAVLAVIMLFLRGLMYVANHLVVNPLRKLHGNIAGIVAGDLETPLPMPVGVREVAEASCGVERMRSALHQSTLNLKREVVDRTVALSRQIMRFDMAISNLKHGLAMFDASGHLIVCNDPFIAQFGLKDNAPVPGMHRDDIVAAFLATKGYGADRVDTIRRRLARSAGYRQEKPHVVHSQTGQILEITFHAMPDGGALYTVQDATDRRRYQARLTAAVDAAQQASEAKSLFLANMSHELRTPLNAIIGFSEVLLNDLIGPLGATQRKDYARNIYESGRHLLALINNILNLSKAEAGALQVSVEPMDVDLVMRTSRRSVEQFARQNDVQLSVEIAEDCPIIETDSIKVIQVVTNLISNAVKFSPPGSVVRITACAAKRPGWLDISVADSGVGMAEADIPRAFEVFHQLDSSFRRRYEGVGLGLPLSKRLVELMGGEIGLSSKLGIGTTARIALPSYGKG